MENSGFHVFWRLWAILCSLHHVTSRLEVHAPDVDPNVYFEMIEPEEISYTYRIRPARGFGIQLNRTLYHAELVPSYPLHGCSPPTNSEQLVGNIAFMKRGDCSFLSKTLVAQQAGAQLVIIYDYDSSYDGKMIDMIPDGTDRTASIPAFYLQGKDGRTIVDTLAKYNLESALINVPVNITGMVIGKINQPPWNLW